MNLALSRLVLLASLVCGCASAPPPPPAAARRLAPEEIPSFADKLPRAPLVQAVRASLKYFEGGTAKGTYKLGDAEYTPAALAESLRHFLKVFDETPAPAALDRRLREEFDVFQSTGMSADGRVVFSSYYEPTFPASPVKDATHTFPLFMRPPDLIDVDLGAFQPRWKGERVAGRISGSRLVPYLDREDIDSEQALAGKGLEIAWLEDAFDRLDLHIEGSGILHFPDGRKVRAQFDGTSAQPYRSVGKILVETGAIAQDEVSHERVRQYFRDHPDAARWVIARNPRYTFFKLEPFAQGSGAIGTGGHVLTAGRSIALDDRLFPLGALCFIAFTMPITDEKGALLGLAPESRFVIAQDTGGAITGPGRVDFFAGAGEDAKAIATRLWNDGRLYFLVKKLPPPRR